MIRWSTDHQSHANHDFPYIEKHSFIQTGALPLHRTCFSIDEYLSFEMLKKYNSLFVWRNDKIIQTSSDSLETDWYSLDRVKMVI